MSTFNRFEDINAWQKARELVNQLYNTTNDGDFKNDFTLKNQINGAALSIMLNIAEGFGRKSNKEFANFLVISHGSVSEVQSALYAAMDRKHIDESQFNDFYSKCSEISKMIMGLTKYLRD
jgi:four helix bundle protein